MKSNFMNTLYESYLSRIEHITTLYSVIALNELQISSDKHFLDDSLEIPLSTNFGNWATIKNKRDIVKSVESGHLYQINCYQVVVSLVSNFEDFVERIVKHFSITKNELESASPISLWGKVDSPLLKKIYAIHEKLSIHSNVINRHETGYYYMIIKVRNCIVHRQGIPNSSESDLLQSWIIDDCIAFDRDQIDDFVHFFLMPLTSMVTELDQWITDNG